MTPPPNGALPPRQGTGQLAFDLPPRTAMTRADFIVTPANRLAFAAVEGWRLWPGGKMLLVGPAGSGKTHLARIWAEAAGPDTAWLDAGDLAGADPAALAAQDAAAVVVEDAQTIAGNRAAETALFHLHNLLAARTLEAGGPAEAGGRPGSGGRLLVTAACAPRDWGLVLPDLLSRMQAAPLTRIDAPDDALLEGVLTKLFADRQIAPAPGLLAWLVNRMPRSIGAARAIVAELDARALAERRPIGPRLAAEVLGHPAFSEEADDIAPAAPEPHVGPETQVGPEPHVGPETHVGDSDPADGRQAR